MFSFLHVHPNDQLFVYTDSSYAHTTPTFEVTPDSDPDVTGYSVKLPLPCGGQVTQVIDASTTKQIASEANRGNSDYRIDGLLVYWRARSGQASR